MEEGADYEVADNDDDDEGEELDGEKDDGASTSASAATAKGARYGEKEKKVKEGRALGGAVDVSCALDYKLLVKVDFVPLCLEL